MTVHPMDDKTVVITGANSGIGLETAVSLAGAGANLVLGCRNVGKAAAAIEEIKRRSGNENVVNHRLDLASLTSVRSFAEALSYLNHVDVLINNAGIVLDEREETAEGFEAMFGTNYLGPYLLTKLLLPQLRAADHARIVNVASIVHGAAIGGIRYGDLDRNGTFGPWRVYGESKLAGILHAEELANRLEGTGIVANSLHPGVVDTQFGKEGDTGGATGAMMNLKLDSVRSRALKTPAQGAATTIHLASSPEAAEISGAYWVNSEQKKTYSWTRKHGDSKFLWSVSDRMISAAS